MIFCTLNSGSSGNAILLSYNQTNILIDCGMSGSKTAALLNDIGINPKDINAILVTHEHIDHTKGVGIMSRKYNIPIVASDGTYKGMNVGKVASVKTFNTYDDFEINDIIVSPFEIPHDALMPTGYKFKCGKKTFSVATDIGHLTKSICDAVLGSNSIILEANYDEKMLINGSYPYPLKKRIHGKKGHLCNDDTARFASYLAKNDTKNILLGHLSCENNTEKLAYKTVSEFMLENGIDIKSDINLSVAPRYETSINIGI